MLFLRAQGESRQIVQNVLHYKFELLMRKKD